METSENLINPLDRLYIDGLKSGDRELTGRFFYGELAGLISSLRFKLFKNSVDYDEIVNELYVFLARNNWAKLDGFTGRNSCRLRTWMIPVATRHLLSLRGNLGCQGTPDSLTEGGASEPATPETWLQAMKMQMSIDIGAVIGRMDNRRYAEAIRLLVVEGYSQEEVAAMWGMRRSNVANIKHRAIVAFLKLYGKRS